MIQTLLGAVPADLALAVSWTANAVAVLCVIPLLISTWRYKRDPDDPAATDPPPATWGIWAAAGIVGSTGMAMAGAPAAAWGLKLALSVGPLAVAIVATLAGVRWRANRSDGACLALAGLGLVALLFGQGMVALWLSIAVNIIGTPPTVLHALRTPFRARFFPFACAAVSVLAVVLFAIPWPWTVAAVAYPLYLLGDVAIIMVSIAYGRRRARARELAGTPA